MVKHHKNRQTAHGAAMANNEAQMGAATTRSNEGGNIRNATEERRARRRTTDPMWAVNALIIRKFNSLPSDLKSTDTKLACVKAVIGTHTDLCPDMAKYFTWLLGQAELIQHSYNFKEDCKGVDAQAVSEHLVLEGKKTVTAVRLDGLAATIPAAEIKMFGQSRLVPKEYRYETMSESVETEGGSYE